MRAVPSIPQAAPVSSLTDALLASLWIKVEVWRLRWIRAGLIRAAGRGDALAFARWCARADRVAADLEAMRVSQKTEWRKP